MDTGKFDDLARAIGRGASRRTVLKGVLGLGGLGALGKTLAPGAPTEAARRPRVTPTPIPKCPGIQVWNGTTCVCPAGNTKCGPDCCPVGQAECCDSECCYGDCYGEELCCERVGDVQPLVCTYRSGTECCAPGDTACCTTDGCCDGECYGGMDGAEFCCPAGQHITPEGHCCPNADDAYCTTDECCAGECFGGDDGVAFCCERIGDQQPISCVYRQGADCCAVGDTSCCTTDGCCAGECYGGMDGAELCCPTAGFICNSGECCESEELECCTVDGCCTGECYGGEDDESYCCVGIICTDSDGDFCREGGECCDNFDCPNDPVTCQTGVCNDGICSLVGPGCTGDQTCCGGDCCAPGACCQNEGGFSICLSTDLGNCCTVEDCAPVELPPCWEQRCQYDSESGGSFCANVNTCFRTNEICCNNVCLTGTVCPECSEGTDCGPAICANATTVLQPACSGGECVDTEVPCQTIDPCQVGVCRASACFTEPPDTCNPRPGVVCCPPGWSCPIANPTDCVCMEQYVCNDGSCASCCTAQDCASNLSMSVDCVSCTNGGCVPFTGTPCDLGGGVQGICNNGTCIFND